VNEAKDDVGATAPGHLCAATRSRTASSVWFFNRPKFLLPPHLRDRRGALLSRNPHHRHERPRR